MSKYIDELTELICDTVRTVFPNASLDDGYDVADEVIAKLPTIEVSEDVISRANAIKAVKNVSKNYTKEGDREWHPHIDFIVDALEQVAPSVVPSRAEGEWIPCTKEGYPQKK